MHLLIDPRAGSEKFLKEFEGQCEELILSGGDIAFFGNGPDDVGWFIGIEHKQVNDVIDCMKTGRFAGTQLPEMMKLYDMCFLLIEGNYEPDFDSPGEPRLWIPRGRGFGAKFGMPFKAFHNFITSVSLFSAMSGKPCIVQRAKTKKESVEVIKALYNYFQKPWADHIAMTSHDQTKMQRVVNAVSLLEPNPGEADYPKLVLRKSLYQIQGLGWEVAGALAGKYVTLDALMSVPQRELESVEHVGKVLAKRIYETLHGYADPNYSKRRKNRAEADSDNG